MDNELTEHEYDHVFVGITDAQPEININEVLEWKYISYEALLEEIENYPEQFTVWFKKIYKNINVYLAELTQME